jgi:hypothetical protein
VRACALVELAALGELEQRLEEVGGAHRRAELLDGNCACGVPKLDRALVAGVLIAAGP